MRLSRFVEDNDAPQGAQGREINAKSQPGSNGTDFLQKTRHLFKHLQGVKWIYRVDRVKIGVFGCMGLSENNAAGSSK